MSDQRKIESGKESSSNTDPKINDCSLNYPRGPVSTITKSGEMSESKETVDSNKKKNEIKGKNVESLFNFLLENMKIIIEISYAMCDEFLRYTSLFGNKGNEADESTEQIFSDESGDSIRPEGENCPDEGGNMVMHNDGATNNVPVRSKGSLLHIEDIPSNFESQIDQRIAYATVSDNVTKCSGLSKTLTVGAFSKQQFETAQTNVDKEIRNGCDNGNYNGSLSDIPLEKENSARNTYAILSSEDSSDACDMATLKDEDLAQTSVKYIDDDGGANIHYLKTSENEQKREELNSSRMLTTTSMPILQKLRKERRASNPLKKCKKMNKEAKIKSAVPTHDSFDVNSSVFKCMDNENNAEDMDLSVGTNEMEQKISAEQTKEITSTVEATRSQDIKGVEFGDGNYTVEGENSALSILKLKHGDFLFEHEVYEPNFSLTMEIQSKTQTKISGEKKISMKFSFDCS